MLVIDDDPVVCELIEEVGQQEGLRIHTQQSAEGLTSASLLGYRMVLLDLMLPGIDGVQVIDIIGALPQQPHLVLISGADPKTLNAAIRLAENKGLKVDSLPKPIRSQSLIALFYRHLPELQQQLHAGEAQPPAQSLSGHELLAALELGQLQVLYQPVFDPRTQDCVGIGACWNHPELGRLSQDQFQPTLDDPGVAGPLLQQLITQATQVHLTLARKSGLSCPAYISVPVSVLKFSSLADLILRVLEHTGFDPGQLILEIPASGLDEGMSTGLALQTRLRLRNIRLVVDNFNPSDMVFADAADTAFVEVKVDLSRRILKNQSPTSHKMLNTALESAHRVHLTVLACGIEDETIAHWAAIMGCDKVQGPYLCPPMPADELLEQQNLHRALAQETGSDNALRLQGKVLLLEDNALLRQIYTGFLSDAGASVDCAVDAESARSGLIAGQTYRCVLIGGPTAWLSLEALARGLGPEQIPPVLMLGAAQAESVADQDGVPAPQAMLRKPVDLQQLLDMVHKLSQSAPEVALG